MNFGPANGPNVYIFCRGPVLYLNNCSVQPADIASPYYGAPTPYYINLYCPQQREFVYFFASYFPSLSLFLYDIACIVHFLCINCHSILFFLYMHYSL